MYLSSKYIPHMLYRQSGNHADQRCGIHYLILFYPKPRKWLWEKYNGVYITVLFTYRQAEGMLKTSKHTMHC